MSIVKIGRVIFTLFCLHFGLAARAQVLDTLQMLFESKPSIDLRLESRNSFIANKRALISGVRVGLAFKRKLRMGIGLSWLSSEIKDNEIVMNEQNKPDTLNRYLKLGYICYYLDFVFYKTKRWQLSVPIQAGTGMSWFQNTNTYDLHNGKNKSFLLLYEPGISTQFKIFKWFGLGVDIGYRFTLRNNYYVDTRLNSPTYAFKVQFWADQLFYELFPKSRITRRWGPAVW